MKVVQRGIACGGRCLVLGVSSRWILTAQPHAAHTDYGGYGNDAWGQACESAGMASVLGVDARGGDVQCSGDGGRARGSPALGTGRWRLGTPPTVPGTTCRVEMGARGGWTGSVLWVDGGGVFVKR
jgi:hypothetical protein